MNELARLARLRTGTLLMATSRILLWGAGKAFVAGMSLLPRDLELEVRS